METTKYSESTVLCKNVESQKGIKSNEGLL